MWFKYFTTVVLFFFHTHIEVFFLKAQHVLKHLISGFKVPIWFYHVSMMFCDMFHFGSRLKIKNLIQISKYVSIILTIDGFSIWRLADFQFDDWLIKFGIVFHHFLFWNLMQLNLFTCNIAIEQKLWHLNLISNSNIISHEGSMGL